jgi:hypothetical protein
LATQQAMVPTPGSDTSFTDAQAVRVDLLDVEDELGQILDGVDVVVRRRGDQVTPGTE